MSEMVEIIGVRFKDVGKVYCFDPNGMKINKAQNVIVETARGIECGFVAMDNREIPEEQIVKPLKKGYQNCNRSGFKEGRGE